jgi:HEPN domain
VNQAELRQMALQRIRDARVLLNGGRWEFAYYVSGYAVECALKSCLLARMIHTAWVFEEKWKAADCLTHDLDALIRLAGLTNELNARQSASAAAGDGFRDNWDKARLWSPTSRYVAKTELEARELYTAITHKPDGVLRWIRKFW